MKQKKSITISFEAKIVATALKLAVLSVFLFAFTAQKFSNELWEQLGITRLEGNRNLSKSFLQGYLYSYGVKNARSLTSGNRAALVKDLGDYARLYVSTESFKKDYQEHRAHKKPVVPRPAKSIEQIRMEHIQILQKSIKELEPMLTMRNADIKKLAGESIVTMQKQLRELTTPDNKTVKMMVENEERQAASDIQQYKESYIKWEKDFPEDHLALVKNRLQQFLDITRDVDFVAELKEQNGKKRFVNPLYEAKPAAWKQAFRAGKEATSAARVFAQQWLTELNG